MVDPVESGISGEMDTKPPRGEISDVVAAACPLPAPQFNQHRLPSRTVVHVALDEPLTSQTHVVGDRFAVTVTDDVLADDKIAIPAGTRGFGDITFVTDRGAFGKPGIIGITLRYLEMGEKILLLDGRYREEGGNNNGITAATMFAVGVFSGLIKGKVAIIPEGRVLKARVREDYVFESPIYQPGKTNPKDRDESNATLRSADGNCASVETTDTGSPENGTTSESSNKLPTRENIDEKEDSDDTNSDRTERTSAGLGATRRSGKRGNQFAICSAS